MLDLAVFQDNRLVWFQPEAQRLANCERTKIQLDELTSVIPDLPALFAAFCRDGEPGPRYLQCGGQVFYEWESYYATLLYQTVPVKGKNQGKIILLDHKCLVNDKVNTLIMFSSCEGPPKKEPCTNRQEMAIHYLDQFGCVLGSKTVSLPCNGSLVFDLRDALRQSGITVDGRMQFVHVTGKGGTVPTIVTTLSVNERTGACCFEHSLPPHYYSRGPRSRIRDEALDILGQST